MQAIQQDFNPFAQAFMDDPYPVLAQLRTQEPVFRCQTGSWVLTRYVDIARALSDPRLGNTPSPYAVVNERNREKYVCSHVANNILPFMDAPAHTSVRKMIGRTFHDQLKSNPPDMAGILTRLLDKVSVNTEVDLLGEVFTPLCTCVLAEVLGMEGVEENPAQIARLKQWSEWFFYLFSIIPSEEARSRLDIELNDFRNFFREHMTQKRAKPGADWLSAMLQHVSSGDLLEEQLLDTCLLLMANGVNADYGLANAITVLLKNPQYRDILRHNPALVSSAADELLRYDAPSLFIARRALEDMELGGKPVRKNTGVLLMLASANHDPEKFNAPHQLDFSRSPNPYLSFGKGDHVCIGRPLVKQLLETALSELRAHIPHMELQTVNLQWQNRAGHRWLKSLPVLWRQEN